MPDQYEVDYFKLFDVEEDLYCPVCEERLHLGVCPDCEMDHDEAREFVLTGNGGFNN